MNDTLLRKTGIKPQLPDEPAVNHCPACGIPLPAGDRWCQFHQAAAGLE